MPVQNSVLTLNPVALGLRDVLAAVPSFSGLDIVTPIFEAARFCPAEKHVLVDHLLGGGTRPCIGPIAEAALVGEELTN